MYKTGEGFNEWVEANKPPTVPHYHQNLAVPANTTFEELFELLSYDEVHRMAYVHGLDVAAQSAIMKFWLSGYKEGEYIIPQWLFEKYIAEEYLDTTTIPLSLIPTYDEDEEWMDKADEFLLTQNKRRVTGWVDGYCKVLLKPTPKFDAMTINDDPVPVALADQYIYPTVAAGHHINEEGEYKVTAYLGGHEVWAGTAHRDYFGRVLYSEESWTKNQQKP